MYIYIYIYSRYIDSEDEEGLDGRGAGVPASTYGAWSGRELGR